MSQSFSVYCSLAQSISLQQRSCVHAFMHCFHSRCHAGTHSKMSTFERTSERKRSGGCMGLHIVPQQIVLFHHIPDFERDSWEKLTATLSRALVCGYRVQSFLCRNCSKVQWYTSESTWRKKLKTTLSKAAFTQKYNYSIDPSIGTVPDKKSTQVRRRRSPQTRGNENKTRKKSTFLD